MKNGFDQTVLGVSAKAPRPTLFAAALVATALSVPVVMVSLIAGLIR